MSFCVDQILNLAGNIYADLPQPNGQSVGYISGWITNAGNLGELNGRLNTCFVITGAGPCIAGGFGEPEAAIYAQTYKAAYFERQASNVLAGGGLAWISMADGDTKITRSDPVNMSKAFYALHENAQKSLYVSIANWKLGHSLSVTVDGSALPSYPSP